MAQVPFQIYVANLARDMRLGLVSISKDTAALYGRAGDIHVCVYAHGKRQMVEVHSSDAMFGQAIAAQLQ